MKTFDDILKSIGEFGPYQKRLYVLLCLPSFPLAGMLVAHVFILGVPEHRCKIPGYDNDTYAIQSDYHASLVNTTIPPPGESEDQTYDRCNVWNSNRTVKVSCSEWVYDTTVYKSTFAKQLNLVCDDAIKIPNAQMVFYFGVLVGSLVYGQLADIFGRQKTMYFCLLILLGCSAGLVGMVEYIGLCVLLFMIGGSTLGVYMTTYVMGMELVGPNKRLWTGYIIQSFLTTGVLYLVLVVYLIREWKYFTLAVALPCVLFLPYYCIRNGEAENQDSPWGVLVLCFAITYYRKLGNQLVTAKWPIAIFVCKGTFGWKCMYNGKYRIIPESCRWQLSKGRKKDALKTLSKVARSNNSVLNEKDLDELSVPEEGRVWHLFNNRRLALRTLTIFFNWFVCSMSYYGVVMYTGSLGGSLYLNFALMTSVEYIAKPLGMLLIDRVGRKKLYIGFMMVGGLACIATIGPILKGGDKLHPVLIALAMVGKVGVTGAFSALYVHSSELYPTVVRNAGLGSSSAVARIGSMIAPYIAKSTDLIGGKVGKIIPLTIFGGAMFISSLLTMTLPETLGKRLPDSMDDINDTKRSEAKEKSCKDDPWRKDIDHTNTRGDK